ALKLRTPTSSFLLLSSLRPPPPRSPLFPYTTLFRSAKVEAINQGRSPFFEPELSELLRKHTATRRFQATAEVREAVRHSDILFIDRKSTRLNSSHEWISYAVFCLKKKKINIISEKH